MVPVVDGFVVDTVGTFVTLICDRVCGTLTIESAVIGSDIFRCLALNSSCFGDI